MKQVLIRNLNLLNPGIYFTQDSIKESAPEPLLTLPYDESNKHTFIKKNKPEIKARVKKAGYPDVFVAYWFIYDGKAIVYIFSENKEVSKWYRHLLNRRK